MHSNIQYVQTNTLDSTYAKYLEQSNSQNQKVYWQMPGAGGRGEVMGSQCLMGTEFWFRKVKNSGDG